MYIGHHGTDVTRAIRRLAVRGVLDAVEVVDHWFVVVHRVAFVDGVDLASCGDLDLYF